MIGPHLRKRDYPGRFTPLDTWAVRMPAGPKALLALTLSLTAFWMRTPALAGGLGLAVLALYLASSLGRAFLRDGRIILYQFPVLYPLYLLIHTPEPPLARAATVSLQISCAVLPGLWLQRTTSPGDAARALRRVLPGRSAFVLFTSLRFFPVLLRDARSIYAIQALRGAPLRPKLLIHPRHARRAWAALAGNVGLPLVVRALKLSREASLAARARGLEGAEGANLGGSAEGVADAVNASRKAEAVLRTSKQRGATPDSSKENGS